MSTPDLRGKSRKLPRHYWPIMFAWLLTWGLIGVALFVSLGWNPYIGFMVGWGTTLLIEVYQLKRAGY